MVPAVVGAAQVAKLPEQLPTAGTPWVIVFSWFTMDVVGAAGSVKPPSLKDS